MMTVNAESVATALPYDQLVDALNVAFAGDTEVPLRAHHTVPVAGGTDGTLLLMPAWSTGRSIGIKVATVFPDNAKLDSPAVFASYLLLSAETGVPVAVLDGTEITVRRTAAASALASLEDDGIRVLRFERPRFGEKRCSKAKDEGGREEVMSHAIHCYYRERENSQLI